MKPIVPLTRDLVLVGGGHTHALVLRMWAMRPLAGVRLTLINPGPTAPYSGMLPGFVAGHYQRRDLDIDLVVLAQFAGARLVLGSAHAINPEAKVVHVAGRPPIAYDVASVDIGITSDMPALKGFSDHATPAKPLGTFARRWAAFLADPSGDGVTVIGAGVAGAELAMAMSHALRSRGHAAPVRLIDRSTALTAVNAAARAKLMDALAGIGVEVVERAEIVEVTTAGVGLADGTTISAGFVCGAAGARAQGWLAESGLATVNGFLAVDATLRTSDPSVFATGDCAELTHAPRPKAGVYAVRSAPVLLDNLQAALSGRKLRPYNPQRDYLKLISLGGKSALAERFGRAISGPLMWRWKNRIDQAFMRKFRDLPTMAVPALPAHTADGVREALGHKPMCGGCGAKVGRGALREALGTLPQTSRTDIESVAGDDAAVLVTGGLRQVMTTDHLRSFWADPVVMTRIAAIHALGDVWAMGAVPQAATASLILPRMSVDLQRRTMAEVMQAAQEVMEGAGAAIVGGHSSLGDEFTVGFTVTGLCNSAPITLRGAKAGDAILLTKPLGSGVIMAASMSGEVDGEIVASALDWMQMPQADASKTLAHAYAMTDVTGFGLAGHLSAICEASGVGAEVDLGQVPLMDGAEALAANSVRSTLFDDNRAGAGPVFGASGPRGDLLFDPQTAGGLLAAVSQDEAEELIKSLRAKGYPAAIIGRFVAGEPAVRCLA